MRKLNEIKNLYKVNRKLFNTIILVVNFAFILWQAIVSLILPSRVNVFILLLLMGSLVFLLVKDT